MQLTFLLDGDVYVSRVNGFVTVVGIDVEDCELVGAGTGENDVLIDEDAIDADAGRGLAEFNAVGVVPDLNMIDEGSARAALFVGVGVDGHGGSGPRGIVCG